MENKINDALADSKRWLSSAQINEKNKNYDIALYSAEMALEIAMKGLLIKRGVDYPKKHDVIDYFKDAVASRGTVEELRKNLDDIISTFSKLLDLRNIAGYNFGMLTQDEELAKETRKLVSSTEKYIPIIEKAIK